MGRAVRYTHIAKAYATEISRTKKFRGRPCGELEVLACRRYLNDLDFQDDKLFDYSFSEEMAEYACSFIEEMPHTKGKWMKLGHGDRKGKITLEPWQIFIVVNIFGWWHKEHGTIRFQDVYLDVARKNAKTTLLACCAVFALVALDEYAPEVFLGATSERQARIAYEMARKMVLNAGGLVETYNLDVRVDQVRTADGGFMEPLPANPGDGASPSFAGVDEFHEHKNDRLVNSMETGRGGRDSAIVFRITTAGTNYAGPCWEYRNRVVEILRGSLEADDVFGIIFAPDDDDEWTDFENWKKGNPNLGVSVNEPYLRKQQQTALNSTRSRNIILTKNFNLWCHALDGYFDMNAWAEGDIAKRQDVTEEQLLNARCALAVDMAYKRDLNSATFLFEIPTDDKPLYYIKQRFFLPSVTAQAEENAHYQDYVERGELVVTPGEIIDYEIVENTLLEDIRKYQPEVMFYDTYGAVQMAQNILNAEGVEIEVVEFPQRAKYTTNPMRWTEARIKAKRVRHEGSRCLTWCVGNVRAKDYGDKGVLPRKGPDEAQKIDGGVTIIMAMNHFCEADSDDDNWHEHNDVVFV